LGWVAVPGTLQALPGHCELALHGAATLVPPAHLPPVGPPQIPANVLQKPPVHTPLAHCVPTVQGRPLQTPPVPQSVLIKHALPALVPALHRPETGQSALTAHDWAAELLQTSH
jgi:hypothetical protein